MVWKPAAASSAALIGGSDSVYAIAASVLVIFSK